MLNVEKYPGFNAICPGKVLRQTESTAVRPRDSGYCAGGLPKLPELATERRSHGACRDQTGNAADATKELGTLIVAASQFLSS